MNPLSRNPGSTPDDMLHCAIVLVLAVTSDQIAFSNSESLNVAPLVPIKFQCILTYISGGDVVLKIPKSHCGSQLGFQNGMT